MFVLKRLDATIRQYDPADLEQCRDLWRELTEHHRQIYGDPGIGGDMPGLLFDEHLASVGPERIWVAEHGVKVVGLAGLIVKDREAELEPLIVTPAYRGRGIGRALVERVIAEARKQTVRFLSVRPVARNKSALNFFFEAGFDTLGHIELFMELEATRPNRWKSGPELFGRTYRS